MPLAIKSRIDYVISEKFGTVAPEIEEEAERVIYEFYNSYLDAEQKQTADQRTRYIIKCKSKINLQEYVSDAELEIIDTVKNLLGNISTTDIVHKSHNEEAYTNTEMFRPIYF